MNRLVRGLLMVTLSLGLGTLIEIDVAYAKSDINILIDKSAKDMVYAKNDTDRVHEKITVAMVYANSDIHLVGAKTYADVDLSKATNKNKTELFYDLANAISELEGRHIEDAIWRIWFDESPTPEIRGLLDAGIERREAYDYEAAELHFDKVVEAAPDYAEGYNQRAFIRFLREKFPQAKMDLEKTLELEPNHFGAMSGLFLVLFRQNQQDAAMKMLQQAVTVHPWLQERSSLPKAWWPERYRRIHSPGQEI